MQHKDDMFQTRISRIRKKFSDYKIESLIFFNMNNISYLSGFTGSDGVLVIGEENAFLLVDGRYTTQAKLEAADTEIVEYKDKIKGILRIIREQNPKYIGFEADSVTVQFYNQLLQNLREKTLRPLSDELRLMRACKDQKEISLMKKAAEISSSAIIALIPEIRTGCSERDLALELEMIARRNGADQVAFDPIVAFGENSALPHARPTGRKIKKGDFIVIDFGVKYKNYCSDETCTFIFQKVTIEQKKAYDMVKNAYDRGVDAVAAGISAADIDRLTRSSFGKKNEKYFSHGTGHGVGLEVHESPRLNASSTDVLAEQMVITVEPGYYLPGRFGIRIEDTVLVKKNSCEKLTKMDKGLIIIE